MKVSMKGYKAVNFEAPSPDVARVMLTRTE